MQSMGSQRVRWDLVSKQQEKLIWKMIQFIKQIMQMNAQYSIFLKFFWFPKSSKLSMSRPFYLSFTHTFIQTHTHTLQERSCYLKTMYLCGRTNNLKTFETIKRKPCGKIISKTDILLKWTNSHYYYFFFKEFCLLSMWISFPHKSYY